MTDVNPLDNPTEPVASAYKLAIQNRDHLRDQRAAEVRAHNLNLSLLDQAIGQHNLEITLAESGANLDAYMVAKDLVEVVWSDPGFNRHDHPLMDEVLNDAIEAVRHGGGLLRQGYLGIKSYDRWTGQRNDSPYGYGPRHGHIWFSVGARRSVIANRVGDDDLFTESEIISIVKYLQDLRYDHTRMIA